MPKETGVEFLMRTLRTELRTIPIYKWDKIMEKVNEAKEIEKKNSEITENTSDGYHTFKELYEFRKAYNVALFNTWTKTNPEYVVHKSWYHYDGEPCFDGNWFIVVAKLPTGQISNHYEAKDWNLFNIPEHDKALFPFDNHTGQDVIERLLQLDYAKNQQNFRY